MSALEHTPTGPASSGAHAAASAALGVFTVKTGLLGERSASDLLLPLAPLGEMHGDAATRVLGEAGATIVTQVRAVELDEGSVALWVGPGGFTLRGAF